MLHYYFTCWQRRHLYPQHKEQDKPKSLLYVESCCLRRSANHLIFQSIITFSLTQLCHSKTTFPWIQPILCTYLASFLSFLLLMPTQCVVDPFLLFVPLSGTAINHSVTDWVGLISHLVSLDISCHWPMLPFSAGRKKKKKIIIPPPPIIIKAIELSFLSFFAIPIWKPLKTQEAAAITLTST